MNYYGDCLKNMFEQRYNVYKDIEILTEKTSISLEADSTFRCVYIIKPASDIQLCDMNAETPTDYIVPANKISLLIINWEDVAFSDDNGSTPTIITPTNIFTSYNSFICINSTIAAVGTTISGVANPLQQENWIKQSL